MATESAVRPKAKQLLTEFGTHWAYVGDCCQSAYKRADTLIPIRPLSQRGSPQLVSSGFLQHDAITHVATHQLTVPWNLKSTSIAGRPSSGRKDLTLPPNIRISPQPLADQDIEHAAADYDLPSGFMFDKQSSVKDHRTSVGHSSAHWSSDSAISPNQTPRLSSVSHTDRRTSFGASSTLSHQRVRCSSGAVTSLQPTAVSSSITCSCAPRQNSHRLRERLVLRSTDVELSIMANQPTIEVADCSLRQNMLHVYESYLRQSNGRYRVWLKTRRLVVSQRSNTTDTPQCYSFWLPLTDISSAMEENRLTLRWSDCNQWRTSPLRNNKQSCDCIYDPENLNNEITLCFSDTEAAVVFLNNLCAVYSDCDGVKEWRNVEVVDQQRMLAVAVWDETDIIYRIACVATDKSALYNTFQVFIHWPDLDLDIRIEPSQANKQRSMVIRFDQVSTPNYTSNVVNEPWVDESKIARCVASDLVLGAYSMEFPFEPSSPSRIADGKQVSPDVSTTTTLSTQGSNKRSST